MHRPILLAGLALLAACDLSLSAQGAQPPAVSPELPAFDAASFLDPAPNPWFPLAPGPSRSYEGRAEGGEVDRSVVTVQGPGPTILGVPTVAVLDEAYEDDLLVERTLDYFAADSAGNVWYLGEDVTNYRYDDNDRLIGTDDESAWRAGVNGALPGIVMWAEPRVGRATFEEHAPADEAMDFGRIDAVGLTLRGPAGTFTDVVKVFDGSTIDPDAGNTSSTPPASEWCARRRISTPPSPTPGWWWNSSPDGAAARWTPGRDPLRSGGPSPKAAMPVLPTLSNPAARKLFLARHALLGPVPGTLPGLLDALGFVQVDSVLTLARAHDMILWSRRPAYRPPDLQALLRSRAAFEHWTHDASVLPIAAWPHWRHRFARDRSRLDSRWDGWHGPDFRAQIDRTLRHVADNGPTRSGDLADGAPRDPGWWNWHPSKVALEYLWRVGELSVRHREGFQKVYDLTERVIPDPFRARAPDLEETADWAANAALDRLGFATPGEIAAFWDLLTPAEAQAWASEALARGEVQEILVEGADGRLRKSLARPGAPEEAAALPDPGERLRLLSPFDPALRDRARAERLFGFRYRIEIFVPAAKRTYGYYVFPVLEGARLAARTDVATQDGALLLRALWPEPGVRWGKGRTQRLLSELERAARLAGATRIDLAPDWLRQPSAA